MDRGADNKKLALNQQSKTGFKTEPAQALSVPCRMEAGYSRIPLKKTFLRMVGLYTVLFQFSVGVCNVILLSVAFLIDSSWLVRREVDEKVCVTSLSILLLVIPFTIIHSCGLLLNHPISKSFGIFPKMYLIEMLIPSSLKLEIALDVFNQTNGQILLEREYLNCCMKYKAQSILCELRA